MTQIRNKNSDLPLPGDVYNVVKNHLIKPIKPVRQKYPDDVQGNTNLAIDNLGKLITQLREQDFDGYYIENDKRVLVKYHDEDKNNNTYKLDPIHVKEAEVQALRYLRGMLLIATNSEKSANLLKDINDIYHEYNDEKKNRNGDSANLTLWLSDKFANCLAKNLEITVDQARKQLTMGRDLGVMLEEHPAICTISEDADTVTVEKSTPYKIREQYYEDKELFDDIPNQAWLKNAKQLAGFGADTKDTWLEVFFNNNLENLKKRGVTAPPSARWLPIPANNQIVEINVAERKKDQSKLTFSSTSFLRNGVLIAYDIRNIPGKFNPYETQKDIAKKILRELLASQLEKKILEYKSLYKGVIDEKNFNFYVNYQTLLSPLIGEKRLRHIDNNARFVELVKEVVKELADDNELKKVYLNGYGANLQIHHTNSAVNRNAYLSNEFSIDDATRAKKISEFYAIKNTIKSALSIDKDTEFKLGEDNRQLLIRSGYKPELVDELIKRERACECLDKILKNEEPYKNLSRYQRNIMMAALEHLAMGSQSFTIAGCKSARDRTAVVACAIKTMIENPAAMENWKLLEKSIVKSLKQGHHFRSMIFHSAILKVSLVHKNFMKQLKQKTQDSIKSLLVFSRKPPKYKEEEPHTQANHLPLSLPLSLPDTVDKSATMTITEAKAHFLLQMANTPILKKEIEKNKASWTNDKTELVQKISKINNIDEMDIYLDKMREKQLNTKSTIVQTKDGMKVRMYPRKEDEDKKILNIDASADDFFGSGMDSIRGALAILKYSGINDEQQKAALNLIKKTLALFDRNIKEINKLKVDDVTKLKKAKSEYLKLNSVLADILVKNNCYQDHHMAARGIAEARDLLWIKSRQDEAVCTIRSNEPTSLSFARRITFPSNDLNDFSKQPWFEEFHTKHPWAQAFYNNNRDVLALSPTPMQRSIPNPANAWEEATILADGNKATQIISGIRLGITSPYQVKDKEERQRLTDRNHQLMVSDSRLLSYANKHIEMWDGLLPGNEITIPILHQTLVDPGAIRYAGDRSGGNPKDMVERKRQANQQLQNYLNNKKIYYDLDKKEIVINPTTLTKDYIQVKFAVKETNNGINIHEKMTKKTTKDISDARDLIEMAKDKLLLFRNLVSEMTTKKSIDLQMVISFLTDVTPENPRQMTPEEKESLVKICKDLHSGNNPAYQFLDKKTQRNLALLIQAAVNLASFLSNDTSINTIGFIRDGTAVLHPTFKPEDLNDATYKSCYERILAELLGVRMGGCKSALDREQEIAELTHAMYRQFHSEGKISNYYDDKDVKDTFLKQYVNTQHKHNMSENATGNPGTSDRETQGQAYHMETKDEKKISILLEHNRYPAHVKKDYSYDQYKQEENKQQMTKPFRWLKSLFFHGTEKQPSAEQEHVNTMGKTNG